jgi:predicted anti-sigma-YlaC factor YlaD
MLHLPFEEWILSEEARTPDERRALETHLRECPACAGLARSLAAVERTLGEAVSVAPQPGFRRRFAQRLEMRRVHQVRRQGWVAFGVAAAAAAMLIAPLALRVGTEWTSPADVLVQMLIRCYDLWVGLRVADGFTRAVVSNLSEIIPPVWILGFLAACAGFLAVWLAVVYRFAFRRVKEGVAR